MGCTPKRPVCVTPASHRAHSAEAKPQRTPQQKTGLTVVRCLALGEVSYCLEGAPQSRPWLWSCCRKAARRRPLPRECPYAGHSWSNVSSVGECISGSLRHTDCRGISCRILSLFWRSCCMRWGFDQLIWGSCHSMVATLVDSDRDRARCSVVVGGPCGAGLAGKPINRLLKLRTSSQTTCGR